MEKFKKSGVFVNVRNYNQLCVVLRSVPEESLCDPNGDSTLAAVRLDNNYIDVETVSPSALSCVQSSSSVVLKPQLSLKSKHQTQPND